MNKNIWIGLVLAALFVIMIQYAKGSYTEKQLEDTREQLSQLKDQAQRLTEQYEQAAAEASDGMSEAESTDKLIMVAKVPKDCTKAIDWAISQAKSFKS